MYFAGSAIGYSVSDAVEQVRAVFPGDDEDFVPEQ